MKLLQFYSRDSRDSALAGAQGMKVLGENGADMKIKIERARTKVQRMRNWALRKAEELVKVESQWQNKKDAVRIDFTMLVR